MKSITLRENYQLSVLLLAVIWSLKKYFKMSELKSGKDNTNNIMNINNAVFWVGKAEQQITVRPGVYSYICGQR